MLYLYKSSLKHRLFSCLFLLFSMLIVSCGDNSTDSGYNGGGQNNGGSNLIGTEPTFTNVLQIFQQNCSNCHIGNTTNGVRLDSYQNVMESVGTVYGKKVIQPGDAAGSPLVDKIEPQPDNPARMPEGGPYLSSERIDQIRQWIDNGALNN